MKKLLFILALTVAIFWTMGVAMREDHRRRHAQRMNPTPEFIYQFCTESVRGTLKAPSTAVFGKYGERDCAAQAIGNGVWQATGTVDAENSFAAKLRSEWEVFLHWEPARASVLFIRLDDDRSGDREAALRLAGRL